MEQGVVVACDRRQLRTQKISGRYAVARSAPLVREASQVNFCRGQLQGFHGLNELEAVLNGQLFTGVLTRKTVRLEDVNGGYVVNGPPVNTHQDAVVAIQAADHRQHLFGQLLALDIGL